jgi:hypothetical protein
MDRLRRLRHLWHDETLFQLTHERFAQVLAGHAPADEVGARLLAAGGSFEARGSEEEILRRARPHAREARGMEATPDLVAAPRARAAR